MPWSRHESGVRAVCCEPVSLEQVHVFRQWPWGLNPELDLLLLAALQAAVPFCVWLFIWLLAAISELKKLELLVLWHTDPYGTEDSRRQCCG